MTAMYMYSSSPAAAAAYRPLQFPGRRSGMMANSADAGVVGVAGLRSAAGPSVAAPGASATDAVDA